MKTVRIILYSVVFIISVQSISNAETSNNSLPQFQKAFLQINKDIGGFAKTQKSLFLSTHDPSSSTEFSTATSVRGELNILFEQISHLDDLSTTKNIMSIKSERDFVNRLIANQIKYMIKSLDDSIEYINGLASLSSSPGLVSLIDQAKKETRKLQSFLEKIDKENK